ncbi:MAG: RNA-binding protein [Chitinophagales bacterium]|jgi:RNA recognition motif-containing protein|nr:RNA-binding protein [Chitinophagales bacterium]
MNLFIGNLDYRAGEDQLRALFEQVGNVTSVKIVTDRETGRARGFAFVEMADDAAGQKAVDGLNGAMINDRPISVKEARPREERPRNNFNRGFGGGGRRDY